MYVKCGSLWDAAKVFDNILDRENLAQDITIWNSIIDGYLRYGLIDEGITRFRQMQLMGVRPDAYSLSILLGSCTGHLGYVKGKEIHGYIFRNILNLDSFLESALIDMYLTCGRPMDAWLVFDKLEDKTNIVLWNVMIGGLCENGFWKYSLWLYSIIKKESIGLVCTTITSVLSASAHEDNIGFGLQVHCDIIKLGYQDGHYIGTSLLTMYAKSGLIEDAERVFHYMLYRKTELCNAMISAYVGGGYTYKAIKIYVQMRLSGTLCDSFTISSVLSSCRMAELYDLGRMVHAELVKRPIQCHLAVQSALLNMYSKCRRDEDAILVFNEMKDRDLVAWCSMISGFCQNMKFKEAWDLFIKIASDGVKQDADIMASVISACAGLEDVILGSMVHCSVIKGGMDLDIFVATSLVDMYGKCGLSEMAQTIFSDMPQKNLVAWNSMLSGYCRNGSPELCISLFSQIRQSGLYPDAVSITSVLGAVSSLSVLLRGKTVHGYLLRHEISSDTQVQNALLDMYTKCGCLKYAQTIFKIMPQKDLVTWNLMIASYGSHSKCLEAIRLFNQMKTSGVTPDDVTFLSLFSSCSHSGLVDEGLSLFHLMREEYGIEPKMEHYVNIVDLLGRAGQLEHAHHFIQQMPIQPDRSVWLCLLSACRSHRNVELGELAADNLIRMEPNRGSNYVQALNLYGDAELWDRAASLRAAMKEKGLKKVPGCSWIEMRNKVDMFVSGDSASLRIVEIHETLNSLRLLMKRKPTDYEFIECF